MFSSALDLCEFCALSVPGFMWYLGTGTCSRAFPSPYPVCSLHLSVAGRVNQYWMSFCKFHRSANNVGMPSSFGNFLTQHTISFFFSPHFGTEFTKNSKTRPLLRVQAPDGSVQQNWVSSPSSTREGQQEGFSPRTMRLAADLILYCRLLCNLLFDTSLIFLSLCTEISWSGKLFHCGVSCVWITDSVWVALVVTVDQK